jgi:outer membrane receptor protein involved in Fe transport
LNAGGERADNAYLYYDANGEKRSRENAGLIGGRGGVSWKAAAGSGRLDASLGGSIRRLEVPGNISSPTPQAFEDDAEARAALHYATDAFLSDKVSFDASGYALFSRVSYREKERLTGDTNNASRVGTDLRWSMLSSDSLSFGTGLSGRYERLDSSNVTDSQGGVPRRFSAGAYLEPVFKRGAWLVSPAVRFDWTSDYDAGFSFSLGSALRLSPALALSANASTSYRAPSFDDLYWPASSGVEGNPSLKPESGCGGDIGLAFDAESVKVTSSAFVRYVNDVILWQPGSDNIWRPSNYGTALYPGFELEARTLVAGPFSAIVSYTYIHSYTLSGGLSLSNDLRVPMVPEHAFSLSFLYENGRLQGGIDFDYTGLRYYKMANIAYDPAHLVVNAHLKLKLRGATSITIAMDNLLNERYESVQGYPMPGFSLRTAFSAKF